MDYGLCLPNFPDGSTPDGIDDAAALAERLGWSTVWTTDHVLVPTADAGDYGRIYDALLLRCAVKVKAEAVFTWNLKHFRAINPSLAPNPHSLETREVESRAAEISWHHSIQALTSAERREAQILVLWLNSGNTQPKPK
jgi:hypothetical protein